MIGYAQAFEGLYGPKPIEGEIRMNERIRELVEQCWVEKQWDNKKQLWIDRHVDLNKFAELIVRECVGCCEQVISDPVPESVDTWLNGGSQCIVEIKQHFGVKE